jgi:hypothetical protein
MDMNKRLLEIKNRVAEISKITDATCKKITDILYSIKEDHEKIKIFQDHLEELNKETTELLAESESIYQNKMNKAME